MKRLFVVVGSLLVLPAFAEVAPQIIYADGVEYIDDAFAVNDAPVMAPEQIQQPEINQDVQDVAPTQDISSVRARARSAAPSRSTASSRLTATRSGNANTSLRSDVNRRSVATRGNTTGNKNTAPRTVARASVVAPNVVSGTNVQTLSESTSNTKTSVLGGGTTLYNSNPRVAVSGARVSSRNSGLSFSASNSTNSSTQSTDELDKLAEITDYCKAQYAMCMDDYCNVLDDNQGRCSCSANLSNYEKTEKALADTTEALQDVAQQIQYIGLSAGDIETIFTATEAELNLGSKSDSTQLASSLSNIKRMIIDVKPGTATSSATSSGMFDIDSGLFNFSFDSAGFDFTSFMNTANNTNTSSISNQRGANLYKTAAARCKASVLNSCVAQGVDASVITNAYDLQIDKACLAYERNLKDANTQMNSTVRNAKSVLEKARLMVAQNRNKYDLRGCVEALDSCMRSEFVCGSDYENCLDTTGKYIVNGGIVIGSTPNGITTTDGTTAGLYDTVWKYGTDKNAWEGDGTLSKYIESTIATADPQKTDDTMSKFLHYKIGYHSNNDNSNNGMCISVLNQCQNYTYSNNKYMNNNVVIKEYMMRALTQIKASQDNILAEYAENCLNDVDSCLSTNSYDRSPNTAINACKKQITTCMNVNATPGEEKDLSQWVRQNINVPKCDTGKYYDWSDGACKTCTAKPEHAIFTNQGGSGLSACTWACDTGYKKNDAGEGCVPETPES